MPYYRDCPAGTLANFGPGKTYHPDNVPPPDADPYTVAPEYRGGCALRDGVTRGARRVGRVGRASRRASRPPGRRTRRSRGGPNGRVCRPGPHQPAREDRRADASRRSRRGATTPAASTPCSATARSGSSRARSTARPGGRWGASRAARSWAAIPTEPHPSRRVATIERTDRDVEDEFSPRVPRLQPPGRVPWASCCDRPAVGPTTGPPRRS